MPPVENISSLLKIWSERVTSADLAGVLALYHPSAVLKPTLSRQIRQGREQIKSYFVDFLQKKITGVAFAEEESWHRQLADSAIAVGHYRFAFADGTSADADYTFVWQAVEQEQLILAHHSSLAYTPS